MGSINPYKNPKKTANDPKVLVIAQMVGWMIYKPQIMGNLQLATEIAGLIKGLLTTESSSLAKSWLIFRCGTKTWWEMAGRTCSLKGISLVGPVCCKCCENLGTGKRKSNMAELRYNF